MQLNEIQDHFKSIILRKPDQDLQNLPDSFFGAFQTGSLDTHQRLRVYRGNVQTNISNALISMFPILEKLVGRDFLKAMSLHYMIQHPPTSGNLNDYGGYFDRFIANFEPARAYTFLPDVARFEIAIHRAYYAPDDTALTAEDLAAIPQDQLFDSPLKLRSSAHLLHSRYPLDDIKDFCEADNDTIPAPDLSCPKSYFFLIFRPALSIRVIEISADSFTMLCALKENAALGQALESTLNQYPRFDIQSFLQTQFSLETFKASLETFKAS